MPKDINELQSVLILDADFLESGNALLRIGTYIAGTRCNGSITNITFSIKFPFYRGAKRKQKYVRERSYVYTAKVPGGGGVLRYISDGNVQMSRNC